MWQDDFVTGLETKAVYRGKERCSPIAYGDTVRSAAVLGPHAFEFLNERTF